MELYKAKISKEEVNKLDLNYFKGKIYLIDKHKQVPQACAHLQQFKILGFDTETKPTFKKNSFNKVALLQLATPTEAFLFRLNKIGLPQAILKILSNEKIIKTGVAIKDDIKQLNQRKIFTPAGFVELQELVNQFGIEDAGLRKLTANILGFRISKSQQISNWENQKLTKSQLTYAATDAWVGCMIYKKLTGN